jgi:hypothetical protein
MADRNVRPAIAAGGASVTTTVVATSTLVYADEKMAQTAVEQLLAIKTDLIRQGDPATVILQEVKLARRGNSVIAAGQWGITDAIRLIADDPRKLGPSLMKIGQRLGLLE